MTDSAQGEMYYCDYLYYGSRRSSSSTTLRECAAHAMYLIDDCAGSPQAIRHGSKVILEGCDYDSLEELYRKALRGEIS